jgi:hypothetical protein
VLSVILSSRDATTGLTLLEWLLAESDQQVVETLQSKHPLSLGHLSHLTLWMATPPANPTEHCSITAMRSLLTPSIIWSAVTSCFAEKESYESNSDLVQTISAKYPDKVAELSNAGDERMNGATLLHLSILAQDVPLTLALLEVPSVRVDERYNIGQLPIHVATSSFLLRLLRESPSPNLLMMLLQANTLATARLVADIVEASDVEGMLTLLLHSDIFPVVSDTSLA